jgi:UDP-glucose 6-dehydrogenase
MTTAQEAPVLVVGASHVGLVTAVGIAQKRQVRLVDKGVALIEGIRAGNTQTSEPDLDARLGKLGRRQLRHYTNLGDTLEDRRARLIFVAVEAPTRASRADLHDAQEDLGVGEAADLRAVNAVVDGASRGLHYPLLEDAIGAKGYG